MFTPAAIPGVRLWVIATPNHTDPGGVQVENLRPGEDISRLQGLSPEGHRPYHEESIYASAEPVRMDRLQELAEICGAACSGSGRAHMSPCG